MTGTLKILQSVPTAWLMIYLVCTVSVSLAHPYTFTGVRYVSPAGSTGITATVSGNDVAAALAEAKLHPYGSIDSAVTGLVPGTIVIVGDGTYRGKVVIEAVGDSLSPIVVLAEHDRGATVVGVPQTYDSLGTLFKGGALGVGGNHGKYIQVHNLRIEGRGIDDGTSGTHPVSVGGDYCVVAGCYITGTAAEDMMKSGNRGLQILGNRFDPSEKCPESGIDFLAAFDFEVMYNTFTGHYSLGAYQFKAGCQDGRVERNYFNMQADGDFIVAQGGNGSSRERRPMKFVEGVDDYLWAEASRMLIRHNHIVATIPAVQGNERFAIDNQGATLINVVENYIEGTVKNYAFGERRAYVGFYQDQTTDVPPEYQPYVEVVMVDSVPMMYIYSRFNTFIGNRWTAGVRDTFALRDYSTAIYADNDSGPRPFSGPVGEDAWNRLGIYADLGLPGGTAAEPGGFPDSLPSDFISPVTVEHIAPALSGSRHTAVLVRMDAELKEYSDRLYDITGTPAGTGRLRPGLYLLRHPGHGFNRIIILD